MRLQNTYGLLLAAGGMLLSSSASADDDSAEGVVRLGRSPQTVATSADTELAQQVSFSLGQGGSCDSACDNGCVSGNCEWGGEWQSGWETGTCGQCGSGFGSCGYGNGGYGNGGYGNCGYGNGGYGNCGYGNGHTCGLLDHLRGYAVGGCHHSPDHGWAPPGKHPRPRMAATYRNWFPNSWTGQGAHAQAGHRYPMVYTPTDTTQLGYYYQRVPVWQHRHGMIPPVPHPEAFHVPDFGGAHHGVCHNGLNGAGAYGYQGEIIGGSVVGDAPPAGPSLPIESAPPQPATPPPAPETPPVPDSTEPAPPAPAPEAPPAVNAPALEKSALAPFLYAIPAR